MQLRRHPPKYRQLLLPTKSTCNLLCVCCMNACYKINILNQSTHAITHTHARTHTHSHAHTYTHTHTHTHARTHTHTHTHTRTHSHTHTHARALVRCYYMSLLSVVMSCIQCTMIYCDIYLVINRLFFFCDK